MKKTNKEKVKEFIRVDHAGERGAVKIYEGQLLALNTFVKDENLVVKRIKSFRMREEFFCDFSGFACLNGSCKFCTAQGKKVYVSVVEIMLFK